MESSFIGLVCGFSWQQSMVQNAWSFGQWVRLIVLLVHQGDWPQMIAFHGRHYGGGALPCICYEETRLCCVLDVNIWDQST